MSGASVEAGGLQVPEGPTVLAPGVIAFVEQVGGRLSVFDGGAVRELAKTGGAPNATVSGSDGCLYVCQNGGMVGSWRSRHPQPPSIQRVDPDGAVTVVATTVEGAALGAPNDLVFGPDGRLYFTDPAQPFAPASPQPQGRIASIGAAEGDARLVADVGGVYCNGIAVTSGGALIWAESYTRAVYRLSPAGERHLMAVLPPRHTPDGLAVADDGRLFITTCESHGIDVLGPTGAAEGFIVLDDTANPTNCCFDGATLWVTDFGMAWETAAQHRSGRLWAVSTDATGGVSHRGTLSS